MKKLKLPTITATISLVVLAFSSWAFSLENRGDLRVVFLDVGQGDAIFIESPTGTQVLIDGGRGGMVLGELSKQMGFFDRDIDMVVATHPDLDHIGGLIDVIDRYDVGTILMTEQESDTPAYEVFYERVLDENVPIRMARRGQVYDLGSGEAGSTTLTILFPDRDPRDFESNASSIIAQLRYGETEYLFTGDAPSEIEEYVVSLDGEVLESDVLKAGHHGSRTSSGEMFIDAVQPVYVIYSAGRDNTYGHPHEEVVSRFTARNVTQKNTADLGSISSWSSGTTVFFR